MAIAGQNFEGTPGRSLCPRWGGKKTFRSRSEASVRPSLNSVSASSRAATVEAIATRFLCSGRASPIESLCPSE
jgi:hypothetical protein